MKCLNCNTPGKHFAFKICPSCTSKGVKKSDIKVTHEEITFVGTREEVNIDAGKHIEDLRKEKTITHVNFEYTDGGPKQSHLCKMKVTWKQYEPKAGKTNG